MAADDLTPPEGMSEFQPNRDEDEDDDNDAVELSPGEQLHGLVLSAVDGENELGAWVKLKIKDENRGVVVYFAKGAVKSAYFNDRIEEGEPIWIGMTAEEESFEDDDGEMVTYNPTKVAFPESDD